VQCTAFQAVKYLTSTNRIMGKYSKVWKSGRIIVRY
jgi:hypothetical protein